MSQLTRRAKSKFLSVAAGSLMVWTPNDLRRGMTTVVEAANKVKDAAEDNGKKGHCSMSFLK